MQGNLERSGDKQVRSLTKMFVIVCVVFLVTVLPPNIYMQVRLYKYTASENLLFACMTLLFFTNSATNFLLYFVTGSRFRKALYKLASCQKG